MADDSRELGSLREQIDELDGELLRLINQRAKLARRIGEIKQGNIYRPEREAQVLRRVAEHNPGPLTDVAAQRVVREVMSACLALEQPLKIAYLGPAGTYSESAAHKHFGSAPSLIACPGIDDVFRAVEAGNADYGVVPLENSTEGAIGRTLDLLLSSPLQICGEVNLPIHHKLLALGKDTGAFTRVCSHAQSLAQCHEWLNRNFPTLPRVPVASNAEAARLAASDGTVASIAGDAAAELYGLAVVADNIEDDPNNTTRFAIVAGHDAGQSGQDRTSLVCSAQNRPGGLYRLLAPFADNGVSMTRLESRPARGFGGSRWEYVFYIDIEGHRSDDTVTRALDALRDRAGFVKILGSYPKAVF